MKKSNVKRLEKLRADIDLQRKRINESEILKLLSQLNTLLQDDESPFKKVRSLLEELDEIKHDEIGAFDDHSEKWQGWGRWQEQPMVNHYNLFFQNNMEGNV